MDRTLASDGAISTEGRVQTHSNESLDIHPFRILLTEPFPLVPRVPVRSVRSTEGSRIAYCDARTHHFALPKTSNIPGLVVLMPPSVAVIEHGISSISFSSLDASRLTLFINTKHRLRIPNNQTNEQTNQLHSPFERSSRNEAHAYNNSLSS